ncbi:MAG: hypothetical protein JNM63_11030, partial [Spirochaetia bacterium]|nr:hypothetical protein [Spirochaetia bacterium]
MRFHSGISDHTLLTPGSFPADLKFFAFGASRAKKNWIYPLQTQTTHQLIFVAHGSCQVSVNAAHFPLRSGLVFFAMPGDALQLECSAGTRYYSLKFSFLMPDGKGQDITSLFAQGTPPKKRIARAKPPLFIKLAKEIEHEAGRDDAVSPRIVEAKSKEFFWQAVRLFPEKLFSPAFVSSTGKDPFQSRLAELFARSLSEKMSVPEMAGAFGMSESA